MTVLPAIQEGQFRLLKIIRVSPALECEVKVQSLPTGKDNEKPADTSYFALSYAWGAAAPTRSIIVNGQLLEVTVNLWAALVELHRREEIRDARHWIDQICIDQSNENEKSSQVNAMHIIYTCARRTLIWLGPANEESDLAMDNICNLTESMGRPPYPTSEAEKEAIHHRLAPRNHPVWRALVKLFGRPYFQRVWILQEVVLCNGAFVLCGDRTLAWEALVEFSNAISAIWPAVLMDAGQDPLSSSVSGFVSCSQIDRFKKEISTRQLFNLLITTRDRDTSDAIDHLYGIRAMLTENQKPLIQVDYSRPYAEAVIRFSKGCIDKDPWLRIHSMAASRNRTEGLPSWCPDLRHRFSDGTHFSIYPAFRAGFIDFKQRVSRIRVLPQPSSSISVPGFRLDVVSDVVKDISDNFDMETSDWESKCAQLLESTRYHDDAVDDTAATESYARTLIAGHWNSITSVPSEYELRQDLQGARQYWREVASKTRTDFSTYSVSKDVVLRYDIAVDLHRNRKFFTTEKGRIGLGPSKVEPGDVICVFYSGSCLWVLRENKSEATFVLVGEAYMGGLMDLQDTLKSDANDRGKDEDFVIV